MLTLYSHPFSQHARRVRALLEEAGIPYTLEHVALNEGAHMQPEYLQINPNHQVPTLLDGDVKIHESHAILRYLCQKYALHGWYPAELQQRALVDQWLDWNQCRMRQPVIDIVLNRVFMGADGDDAAIERGEAEMAELTAILGDGLAGDAFLAGAQPTIADLSVASNITQLQLAETTLNDQRIAAWYERVTRIPGFARSLPV